MNGQLRAFAIAVATECLMSAFFAVLKFYGVIDWGWALVTLPIWIGPLAAIAFVIVALAFYGIQHARGVDLK